jgi:hypothetical protein
MSHILEQCWGKLSCPDRDTVSAFACRNRGRAMQILSQDQLSRSRFYLGVSRYKPQTLSLSPTSFNKPLKIISRIWGCAWLIDGFGLMTGFIAHLHNLLLHFDCRLERLPQFSTSCPLETPGLDWLFRIRVRVRVRVTLDWRFTANQFILLPGPLGPMISFFNWTLAVIVFM